MANKNNTAIKEFKKSPLDKAIKHLLLCWLFSTVAMATLKNNRLVLNTFSLYYEYNIVRNISYK
jgi:hypothetical protein